MKTIWVVSAFLFGSGAAWAQGCSGSVEYSIGSLQRPYLACDITPSGGAFTYTSSVAYTNPASPAHAWLSVSPPSGTIAAGVKREIDYNIDPTNLPSGDYYANVTLHATGFSDSVDQIHLSVQPGTSTTTTVAITLPSISGVNITLIVDGSTYNSNESFLWVIGSAHTISVPPVIGPGGNQITFVISSSDGKVSGNPVQFTVTSTTISLTITQVSTITLPSISAVTNGASILTGPVAPGEIIAIKGSGLGPSQLTLYRLTAAGFLDTQVASTQVRVNGILAPLIYAWGPQVAAIIPYEVSGNTVQIAVTYNGQTSTSVSVPLASSAPALFTSDASGKGLAAAVDSDGSINGPANPAKAGDFISLFATGEGQTSPLGVDGKPASDPIPQPILRVTVTIGGQPAEVLYAGGVPTEVAGLMQINVKIPSGIQTGNVVPVSIQVGTIASPQGVTIAVR